MKECSIKCIWNSPFGGCVKPSNLTCRKANAEPEMKVEVIKYPTEEDWLLVKKCTLVTVGKETDTPPTEKFKRDILRARHSPIRELKFVFYLKDIPYWVSVHLCRHIHAQPYVKTQRNDRQTAYDRESAPQNAPVDMMWSVNGEELITIANKRLCNLASKATRDVVKMICKEVIKLCPEFKDELVPMCVRNGGVCYEMFPCGERKEDACTYNRNGRCMGQKLMPECDAKNCDRKKP